MILTRLMREQRWAFSSIHFVKVMGNREETTLVGRLWIQMGPSQSERGILDWNLQMPRYVLFSFPKCFCEFLIDSNYGYLNVRILLFQSESIKVFEAFYQCNMCTVKHTNLCPAESVSTVPSREAAPDQETALSAPQFPECSLPVPTPTLQG